jgi:proline iminopeptidase
MRRKLFRYFGALVMAFLVIIIFFFLFPRSYGLPPLEQREGTQYWRLATGSEIAYTHLHARGEKKPYPVIFLQGGPGGPIYDRNIKSLEPLTEAGYDVYLYDQVGCGYSGRLKDIEEYTVERHRKDLEEIVMLLGAEKVILIGQSWGSMLAAEYIAFNPAKIEKVIFTGPGYILPVNDSLAEIKAPDSLGLVAPQFTNRQGRENIYNSRAKAVEWCARSFGIRLGSDAEMDEFATILSCEMGKSTLCDPSLNGAPENRSGFYSMVKTVQSFENAEDIRQKLHNCTVPALIMRGQCDGIKWGYVTEFLELFTNHRLIIIPGAGHSISREQPELYIRNMLEFLQ